MSSDQWGAAAAQPDGGSWPPQPAPAYPAAPGPQYPPQPPGPAGPYAQPQVAPGSPWEPAQSGAYGSQLPAQPTYAQPGYPSPESYGQVPGYPTPDPYAVPGYPPGYDGGYPQPAAPQYPQQPAASYAPAPPQPAPSYAPPPATYPSARSYPQPYPAQAQPQPPAQSQSQQIPYPQPTPTPYPQPPFPQAPGGPPVPTPTGGTARPNNGFALTGALTSVVPVVGLAFSIIGLTKAKVLGGIGRRVAVLGVTLSLVFTAAWGVGGFYVVRVVDSTGADPGCVAAISDYLTYSQDVGTDASAMGKTTYGTPQFTSAVRQYEADLDTLIGKFQADAARANHASVRTAITSLVGDLQQLKTMMGDLATGDFSDVVGLGDISTLNGKLLTDYEHTQSMCTSHTNG